MLLRNIRKTDEIPPRMSMYDLIAAVTHNRNPHKSFMDMHKDSNAKWDALQMFKFPGQRQRLTPVADMKTCKQIVLVVLNSTRKSLSEKQRILAEGGFAETLSMRSCIEAETIGPIVEVFAHLGPIKQFACGQFRIDLYFPMQKVAVECDEHGHAKYDAKSDVSRQYFLEKQLGCTFVRYNPHADGFSVYGILAQLVPMLTAAKSAQ